MSMVLRRFGGPRMTFYPLAVGFGVACTLVATGPWLAGLWAAFAGACVSLLIAWRRSAGLHAEIALLEGQLDGAKRGHGQDKDPETGLPGGEALTREWERQRARYHRRGERFSLVVFSIGGMSQPEATLDATAAATARVALLEVARAEDQVYRLQDGRFAVLLTGAEVEGASRFIGRAARVLQARLAGDAGGFDVNAKVVEWREDLVASGIVAGADGLMLQAALPAAFLDRSARQRGSRDLRRAS